MQGSFAIEVHGWRGFVADHTLFMTFYRCGLVSFGVSRFLISDRLRDLVRELLKIKRHARPVEEGRQ